MELKSMLDKISVCFFENFNTLEDALNTFGFSKSQIKKHFTRSELNKAIKKKSQ